MSDSRKKFNCPSCAKTVKVPLKHLGKRIKCPKCAFVFRAGPKQIEEEIYAELDEDDVGAATLIPTANLVQPAQYAPQTTQPLHALPPSPKPRPSPRKSLRPKQGRNQPPEMTETESYCQSSGLFLIFLPLIATVLPLFGLQLRRGRRAGEFAPLAAMFLGLIGVGMICYARRRQGDAPLLGSAAAALVLFSGIGGFFLVSYLPSSSDGNFDRSSELNQPVFDQKMEAEGFARNSAVGERHRQSRQDAREAMRLHSEEVERQIAEAQRQSAQMGSEMEKQHKEMMEFQREAMKAHEEAMKNLGRPRNFPAPDFPGGPPDFPTPPNFSPPSVPSGPNFSPGTRGGRRGGGGFGPPNQRM